jgi:hypothetical protein
LLGLSSGLPPSFPHQNLVSTSPLPHTHPIHLFNSESIMRIYGEKYRSQSYSLCILLHSCYLISLRPKYLTQHPVLEHPQPTFLLQYGNQVSYPYKTRGTIIVLCISLLYNKMEDKRFCTEWQQAYPDFKMLLISSRVQFWFLGLLHNNWTGPPFQRITTYLDGMIFFLHFVLET